jgi:hypothetical protein
MHRSNRPPSSANSLGRVLPFTVGAVRRFTVAALLVTAAAGCATDGTNTLVVTTPIGPGEHCPYAGLRIEAGLDVDRSATLDAGEVESTVYICNQRVDGRSTAVRTVSVDPGVTCPAGGQRIETGIDDDDDRVLDDTEVDSSAVVCQGTDGADGYTTRVRLVNIPSGIGASACPFGGTRIESGSDVDRDGTLDDAEVDSFQSVCSVQVTNSLFLVESVVENPGANCTNGGTKMTFGLDDDEDGTLDPAELDGTPVYVCNEVILVAGKTSLTVQQAATTAQCTFGGYVYRTGLDDDYNGTLATGEVDSTAIVCNGSNGYRALVEQTLAASNVCSGAGGYRIRSGLDLDYDGVLDAGEVTADNLLCNGASVYGLDGRDSVVLQQSVSYTSYCGGSALAVSSGLDVNYNGYLDSSEIAQTSYLCSGSSGHNALVEVYDTTTSQCYYGTGILIRTGTDYNDSGKLDYSEYTESLVCD